MICDDNVVARPQKSVSQEFDDFIRSISEDDIIQRELKFLCDSRAQMVASAVWIVMSVEQRFLHRRYRLGRRTKGVFV